MRNLHDSKRTRPKKKANGCPVPGCDFSRFDHKSMAARGESCADWRERRRAYGVFLANLRAGREFWDG